jgi:membrane protein DedA with SNARE-associated domain
MTVQAIVDAVVTFVRDHEGWAAPVAFVVAFGESFCFLSLLWPGTAILAAVAALLAASGVSQSVVVPAIVAAGLGGTLGYAMSYWIGLYFKDSVQDIWPFNSRPHLIRQGQDFFERYGAFGVFLGHFFGPVRAVIPVVAGMFAMPQLPFQVANAASAFFWAGGIVAPSFFLVTFKDDVLQYVRDHEAFVATALFAVAFANSIPRPLLIVPTLVVFAGIGALYLFADGGFPLVWIAGAAGALAGDLNAYRTGVRYRGNLKGAWPWTADAQSLAVARGLVESQGAASVLGSKYTGLNRGLVPLMAGAKDMALGPFVAVSAASSLVWSAMLLLPALVTLAVTRS